MRKLISSWVVCTALALVGTACAHGGHHGCHKECCNKEKKDGDCKDGSCPMDKPKADAAAAKP